MKATAVTSVPRLVRILLTHEGVEDRRPETVLNAVERICEKLQAHLSKRVGREGFQTLLARALTLATIPFPHLTTVSVAPNGVLEGLRRAAPQDKQDQDNEKRDEEISEAAIAIVTGFLALLITFIGDDLALRLLGAIWPTLRWNDDTGTEVGIADDAPLRKEKP